MKPGSKVIAFDQAPALFARLRAEGKIIVQCHGTFDLLHPGHMIHFEEAKALGDVLVVTITGEKYVNKGPGRPYFNNELRVKALAAIEFVDYVIVVPYPAAVEAIECVRPHVYCKGKEYQQPETDVTGNIRDDLKTVERLGGSVRYAGSIAFSSTRLLNRYFETYTPKAHKFCKKLAGKYSPKQFRAIVEGFCDLKVLVIGDIIFDRYTTVSIQGLTSKNRILSGRYLNENTQGGGALATFRHIREFTPQVKLISIAGNEPWVDQELARYIRPEECDLVRAPHFTTIIKQRFIEPWNEGKELNKLFSINYIDPQHPDEEVQKRVCDRIATQIKHYDLVLVMDFGHGLMEARVRELVQDQAPFLALNCQTNSNNHGFNIINRQYHRADSFSLDQTEMTLACGRRSFDYLQELTSLKQHLNATYGWLTRGETETIGLKSKESPCLCPALEAKNVVDTVGAGDAFSALASMAAVKKLPIPLATFIGQLAGALKVRTIGNQEAIKKSTFLKSSEAMLTF